MVLVFKDISILTLISKTSSKMLDLFTKRDQIVKSLNQISLMVMVALAVQKRIRQSIKSLLKRYQWLIAMMKQISTLLSFGVPPTILLGEVRVNTPYYSLLHMQKNRVITVSQKQLMKQNKCNLSFEFIFIDGTVDNFLIDNHEEDIDKSIEG